MKRDLDRRLTAPEVLVDAVAREAVESLDGRDERRHEVVVQSDVASAITERGESPIKRAGEFLEGVSADHV
jgi:hypothetical protein